MRQGQRGRKRLPFFLPLLVGLVIVGLNGWTPARARGGAGAGGRWIPIDAAYLRRFPAEVRSAIAAQGRSCGPLAAVRASFARYIHVGAGAGEFITLHFDDFRCADRGLICGADGCLHQVYAPVGASYRLIFNARVHDLEFAVLDGRVAVRVGCAPAGARRCPPVLLWTGSRLAERP